MGRINERKLIDEKPLQLLPSLAQALGLNEAVILQQFHYWLIINKSKERNFRDGYYWTYNSIKEWRKQFPFWNTRTIERALWKLEANGIVKTGKHNKLNLDRTKWYRIDYARLIEVLRRGHNGLFDSDKLSQWLGQYVTMDKATESDNMSSPIPETINTENTTETNGDKDTFKVKSDITIVKDNIPTTDNGSSASACKATATLPKGETTVKDRKDTSTNGDKIEAFLRSHGLASIKAIRQATGIGSNQVNTTLHNGKGKRFIHFPHERAWDVAEKDNW